MTGTTRPYLEAPYSKNMEKHTIITVGRQYYSGGRQVAEQLGKKLGIKVYDSELVAEAAKESGISQELFRSRDEKRRLWGVGSIFGSNRYGSFTSGLNDGELFRIQSEVIRRIALEGDAIFIGRASDYILRDMDTLDVFIYAPMEQRRERYSRNEGVSPEEAESIIYKKDKARAEFYNFFTFGHWGKCVSYDISLDSSILGIEGTADFIIEFGRRGGFIKGL